MVRSLSRSLLFFATAIAVTVYLGWRAFFTLPLEYGLPSIILSLLLLISEIVAGFEAVEQYLNMVSFKEPEMPVVPYSWYPDVDVFIMTHNEEVDILYKTINACTHLDYPDKRKVHVYVCDDTNRPAVRELAGRFGVGYFGLSAGENKHAKAGNLNNALYKTTSPLVASFDADMIPRHTFLMQTVPYFFLPKVKKNEYGVWVEREESELDPEYKIGFIQSPQSFYNPDLFQFNLFAEQRVPNEQDYFFREINVGRNRSNSCLFVGSNALISRQALMDAGGFAINTITEDFETGMRIQAKGYRTYALPKPLAHGLAPHNIPGLIAQRERWGRGCIQSLRNTGLFFGSGLTLSAKISYLSCLVYWWTFFRRFVYIVTPILSVLFQLHVVECTLAQILIFWLPYYFLSNESLRVLSGSTRNQHWNNLIDTALFPYLITPVIKETLGIKKKKFVVTRKTQEEEKPPNQWLFAFPHIFLFAASVLAVIVAVLQIIQSYSLYNIIIIFWLIVNGKNLFFGICFMLGRTNYRKADRFFVNLPIQVEYDNRTYHGVTKDISETGLSLCLGFPVFLPDRERFKVRISTDLYRTELLGEIVHVEPPKNERKEWCYSLRIVEMDEENRRAYFQIVFDRMHTLPDKIEGFTIYDDFHDNIDKRLNTNLHSAIRRLPRIHLGLWAKTDGGKDIFVRDFNYKYVWLEDSAIRDCPSCQLLVAPGVSFDVKPVEGMDGGRGAGRLYHVLNLDRLLGSSDFKETLSKWVGMDDQTEVTMQIGARN